MKKTLNKFVKTLNILNKKGHCSNLRGGGPDTLDPPPLLDPTLVIAARDQMHMGAPIDVVEIHLQLEIAAPVKVPPSRTHPPPLLRHCIYRGLRVQKHQLRNHNCNTFQRYSIIVDNTTQAGVTWTRFPHASN